MERAVQLFFELDGAEGDAEPESVQRMFWMRRERKRSLQCPHRVFLAGLHRGWDEAQISASSGSRDML